MHEMTPAALPNMKCSKLAKQIDTERYPLVLRQQTSWARIGTRHCRGERIATGICDTLAMTWCFGGAGEC